MKTAILTFALMAVAGLATAADKPNLSGSWKADLEKSDFGAVPPPDALTRKVTHVEPSITFEDNQVTAVGPQLTTRKYATDGKEITFESQGADVKSAAVWEGPALVVTSKVESASLQFREALTLAKDGKTMNSVVRITSPQGEMELKILYVKQ